MVRVAGVASETAESALWPSSRRSRSTAWRRMTWAISWATTNASSSRSRPASSTRAGATKMNPPGSANAVGAPPGSAATSKRLARLLTRSASTALMSSSSACAAGSPAPPACSRTTAAMSRPTPCSARMASSSRPVADAQIHLALRNCLPARRPMR